MEARQGKLIQALNRVEDFLVTHQDIMDSVITSTAHQRFSASRERVLAHRTAQDANERSARYSVAARRTLRARLLRKHMRPISVTAKTSLSDVKDLGALVVMRRGNRRLSALVAAGYGMAEAAKQHEATFIAAGLPPDFIQKLVEATDALNETLVSTGETSALRVRATAGLAKDGRIARDSLRIMDVLVRAALEDDDVLLDQWRAISRVVSAATSARALEEPATSAEPSAPPVSAPTKAA